MMSQSQFKGVPHMKSLWFEPRIRASPYTQKLTHFKRQSNIANVEYLDDGHNIVEKVICDGRYIAKLKGESGLQAKVKIAKGVEIMPCFADIYTETEYNWSGKPNEQYASHIFVDGTKLTFVPDLESVCLWPYANDAKGGYFGNNCELSWRWVNRFPVLFIKTKAVIRPREQLFVAYGTGHWSKFS